MGNIVTYLTNPFDALSKTTVVTEEKTIVAIVDSFEFDMDVYELVVAVNDEVIDDYTYVLQEKDTVGMILVPLGGNDGKSVLRIVALMALTVAAPGLGAGAAGLIGIGGTFGNAVMTAAIIGAGTALVNAVLPAQLQDTNSDFNENSRLYGWGTENNIVTEGVALPRLFGTMKVTPMLINRYVETIEDKQYLNCLYAICEGPVDSVTQIKINDTEIDTFDEATYEVRLGTNEQEIISNLAKIRTDTEIGRTFEPDTYIVESEVDPRLPKEIIYTDWYEIETTGNRVIGFGFYLLFSSFLVIEADNGGYDACGWLFELQYSLDGESWGETITQEWWELRHDSRRKDVQVSGLSPNQYYIRYRMKYVGDTDEGDQRLSTVQITYFQECSADDYSYPNTALLGVRALATDQLNDSMPTVTCLVSNSESNPRDCARAVLLECNIEEERIDDTAFDSWQDECTLRGYTFNAYIDSMTTAQEVLDYIGVAGRAKVVQVGSHFSVIQDKAETLPVQGFMFGMGNIRKDSFSEEFLPISDRANVLELSYLDAADDYEKTIVEVSSESYDSDYAENRVSLNLVGFVDKENVIAYGQYQLNCNRYLTVTYSFEAGVDSLVCSRGELIQVSHDVPQYGVSGRIVSSTTTSCVIDSEVTMEVGETYFLRVKRSTTNSVEEVLITDAVTTETGTELTFISSIGTPFSQYDLYAFGTSANITKLMRIIKIDTATDELRRVITAIEYNEDVFVYPGDVSTEDELDDGVYTLSAGAATFARMLDTHITGFGTVTFVRFLIGTNLTSVGAVTFAKKLDTHITSLGGVTFARKLDTHITSLGIVTFVKELT